MTSRKGWWGTFDLPVGTAGRWRIGPTTVWIQHLPGEWRIASESTSDDSDTIDVEIPVDAPDLMAIDTVVRVGISAAQPELEVRPRLADRPVVTRPDRPFYVPPHEAITLYVSSPLWLAVAPSQRQLLIEELPIRRPSDTWFGPSPREGRLCYATRTSCRLQLDEVPVRPHRAVTEVTVRNRADTELLLERMQLPVEHLALYQAGDGAIWTQDIDLERAEQDAPAPLTVRPGPPRAAPATNCISPARVEAQSGALVRAFSAIFR